jgi:hypothetical protein
MAALSFNKTIPVPGEHAVHRDHLVESRLDSGQFGMEVTDRLSNEAMTGALVAIPDR